MESTNFEMRETATGVIFTLEGGGEYSLPSKPDVAQVGGLDVQAVATGAFAEAARLQAESKAIKADAHLSEVGKVGKLQPLRVRKGGV